MKKIKDWVWRRLYGRTEDEIKAHYRKLSEIVYAINYHGVPPEQREQSKELSSPDKVIAFTNGKTVTLTDNQTRH